MADTALATFQVAMARAKYLYEVYSALVNQRKRSIRRDWAESFCELMHWPKSSDIDRVDSHDVVIVIKHDTAITADHFSADRLSDLLRASLVLCVSAMDAYFHCKILAHVVKAANREVIPPKLASERITIADFVRAKRYKRRMTAIRNAIQRTLGFQSLQQADNIATSLKLIGIDTFWESVSRGLGKAVPAVKKRLAKIVRRRNQVAHEGDVSQSKKTRNKTHELQPRFVGNTLSFLETLVDEAEKAINKQLSGQTSGGPTGP
jgi:RiboL-PSP-HEPN